MTTIYCIDCDREIFFERVTELGQRVTCIYCSAEMEVISIDPLELDWPHDDDVEEWDDEDAYDGFADDFPDLEEGDLDDEDEYENEKIEDLDEDIDEDDDDEDSFDEDDFSGLGDDAAGDDPLGGGRAYDDLDLNSEAVEYDDDDDLWN